MELVEIYGDGIFQTVKMVETKEDGISYAQFKIVWVDIAQGLKLIKKELNSSLENARKLNKNLHKQEDQHLIGNEKTVHSFYKNKVKDKSLLDIAVRLKLLPVGNTLAPNATNKEIFDYMQSERTASKEQFLSLLISYYNIDILPMSHLHLYRYYKEDISDILEKKGVIELYGVEDIKHQNKIIAISYESLELIDKISELINITKIFITLPEYITQMKGACTNELIDQVSG